MCDPNCSNLSTMKSIDLRLDEAWSLLVKLKAGMLCEVCGTSNALSSHHVHRRAAISTRWDVDNGICLCSEHHTDSSSFSAHKTPALFHEWLIEKKGDEFVYNLRQKYNQTLKLLPFEKEEMLKELRSEIKEFER